MITEVAVGVIGRAAEWSALSELVASAGAGQGGAVQLVGEAGIGKSTVLAEAAAGAEGFTVLQASGVRAEAQLPFAGLETLLRPLHHLVPALPPAQASAAATALGQQSGPDGGELILGTACLRLFALAAEEAPVLVVADDVHWFDEESWRALAFAVRRLSGEPIAAVLSSRPTEGRRVEGVPTLLLEGLGAEEAASVLRTVHPDLASDVCRQLHDRTGGNPLALVEAAQGLSPAQRRGTEALPEGLSTSEGLTSYFGDRLAACPPDTRHLLLLAALEGRGDLTFVAAAASATGVHLSDLAPAEREGLVSVVGQRVVFRHALVEAALLHDASPEERREAHVVLGAALPSDDTRSVWHAAWASIGPDETVADALAQVGALSQANAAQPSASAAFERAAALTPDPGLRSERLLLAAEAALAGGATTQAHALASEIRVDLLPDSEQGRPAYVRGRAAMLLGQPGEAGPLLLEATRGLDAEPAAEALNWAVQAAMESGDRDFAEVLVARAAQLPMPDDPLLAFQVARARSALLGFTGFSEDSLDLLRTAIDVVTEANALGESPSAWLALGQATCSLGDVIPGRRHFVTAAAHARVQGDLPRLVQALEGQAFAEHMLGEWTMAYATGTRALELMGGDRSPYQRAEVLQNLAEIDAARGDEIACRRRCDEVRDLADRLGLRLQAVLADRREALLDLGLNRLEAAGTRLRRLLVTVRRLDLTHPFYSPIPDLVEVCVRTGRREEIEDLVEEFASLSGHGLNSQAQARVLRLRALVAPPDAYDSPFEESVALDMETGMDFLRARTLLCYGERLRRDRRRVDARVVLTEALTVFDSLDAVPWSQRARAELSATGETLQPTSLSSTGTLTPQELQIAVLVAEGRRNKEIAGMLFLSIRTVEFHLTRVYRKLGVANRAALASRLAGVTLALPEPAAPA